MPFVRRLDEGVGVMIDDAIAVEDDEFCGVILRLFERS